MKKRRKNTKDQCHERKRGRRMSLQWTQTSVEAAFLPEGVGSWGLFALAFRDISLQSQIPLSALVVVYYLELLKHTALSFLLFFFQVLLLLCGHI